MQRIIANVTIFYIIITTEFLYFNLKNVTKGNTESKKLFYPELY